MGDRVIVRMFGFLHSLRRERDLPTTVEVDVPEEGTTGRLLALQLDLPPEMIEGIFVNRTVFCLDHPVHPGDRVAFVPYGTPGPHRVYLGLYAAGREGENAEE